MPSGIVKKMVIPPNSNIQLAAKLVGECKENIIIQPSTNLKGLLMPNIITSAKPQVPVLFKNISDKYVTLKKNCSIGTAMEVDAIIEKGNYANF